MSVEVDLDGMEFKVRGLNINSDIDNKDDLPPPPPLRQNYNEYPTVRVNSTTTETTPVNNDFLPPPPPPPSMASDYIWTPPGLTVGQVGEKCLIVLQKERVKGRIEVR